MFNLNWLRRLNPFANEELTAEEFLWQLQSGRRTFRNVDVTNSLVIKDVTIGGDLEISNLRVKGELLVDNLVVFGAFTLGNYSSTGSTYLKKIKSHRSK